MTQSVFDNPSPLTIAQAVIATDVDADWCEHNALSAARNLHILAREVRALLSPQPGGSADTQAGSQSDVNYMKEANAYFGAAGGSADAEIAEIEAAQHLPVLIEATSLACSREAIIGALATANRNVESLLRHLRTTPPSANLACESEMLREAMRGALCHLENKHPAAIELNEALKAAPPSGGWRTDEDEYSYVLTAQEMDDLYETLRDQVSQSGVDLIEGILRKARVKWYEPPPTPVASTPGEQQKIGGE